MENKTVEETRLYLNSTTREERRERYISPITTPETNLLLVDLVEKMMLKGTPARITLREARTYFS